MRTSNPALNERVFNREIEAARAGWAAPNRPPVDDTVSGWRPAGPGTAYDTMTVGGVVSATTLLIVLLLVGAAIGWSLVDPSPLGVEVPGWILPASLVMVGVGLFTNFRPKLARFTGPVYAAVNGVAVGAASRIYELEFDGIVLQAVGLTIGVFMAMLFLYATRIIKVTDRLRSIVVSAMWAFFFMYAVDFLLYFLDAEVPFIHDSGPLGIGISLVIVVVSALYLTVQFDFVDRAVAAEAPKYMEWFAAFGLLVALLWIYMELLRLLAKLRD